MTDPLEDYLRHSPMTQSQKADVWDAYEAAQDADSLTPVLERLKVPKEVKANLWDLKESSAKPPAPEAAPETSFPTPMQTAGRTIMGGVKAIPGMVQGMVEGTTAPMMAIPNEVRAYAQGKPSPTMEQIRQSVGAVQSGDYLGAVPVVGPLAKQVGRGVDEITTPLQKTIIGGAGTVSPEEMNTASDTGGAAIANIAAPEIARGGVAVAGKLTPNMGKLLKFGPPAAMAAAGHPVAAAKMLMKGALTESVLKPMGNIVIDHVLERIAQRDADGAAAALARGLEKSPEAAKTLASVLEQQANKVAPPGAPTFHPTDGSVEAVAARNAAKRARMAPGPTAPPVVAPEASTALQRPAFVDEAQGVHLPPDTSMPQGYPRGSTVNPGPWERVDPIPEPPKTPMQPVNGNVKLPTVYTKPGPKVKPAAGESPAARALAEKQGKVASPDAIRAAFGETPPPPAKGAMKLIREDQRATVADARPVWQPIAGKKAWILETADGDMLRTPPEPKWTVGRPHKFETAEEAVKFQERLVGPRQRPTPKGTPHGKKGPSGAPLTAAERKAALIKLQESIAANEDIFSAFGVTPQ